MLTWKNRDLKEREVPGLSSSFAFVATFNVHSDLQKRAVVLSEVDLECVPLRPCCQYQGHTGPKEPDSQTECSRSERDSFLALRVFFPFLIPLLFLYIILIWISPLEKKKKGWDWTP